MNRMIKRVLQYLLVAGILLHDGCSSSNDPKPVDCSVSNLSIDAVVQNPTDCNANDGSITASASGGGEPYKFAINTNAFDSSPVFNNLGGGNYVVSVKDKNGCVKSVEKLLQIPGPDPLSAEAVSVPDTECFENNGSIEMNASGGAPPYEYKLGAGAFGNTSSFNNLAPGKYSVSVRDGVGCIFVKSVTVVKGDSHVSLASDIKPLIEAKCSISGCHNGFQPPNLTIMANIISNALQIKSQTQTGRMPQGSSSAGPLTPTEKALIACWVDEGAKNN